jgi:hypothetical protein
MKPISFVLLAYLIAASALMAVNPVFSNVVSRNSQWPPQGSNFSFGGPFEIPWQAVPTTLTDLSTRDTHIIGYCFYNSTSSAITLTIQTKDASPLPLPISGPIAGSSAGVPGTSVCPNLPFGILAKGGWSVQAGSSGVYMNAMWSY